MLLFLWIFCVSSDVYAEEQKIEAVGFYLVGDGVEESPKVAKERARQDALRIALDKAGVYVETFSEIKNFRLTKDEVKIVAGEVIAIENESYDMEILPHDVIKYTATILAVVDTDVIAAKLKQMKDDNDVTHEQTERLRQENAQLKDEYTKLREETTYYKVDEAEQYFTEGNTALKSNDYQNAIELFGKAISLQENYIDAWYSRAKAYELSRQYNLALSDYTKLIELTSESADSFYLRGTVYEKLGERDKALDDFNQALAKAPKDKRIINARKKLLAGKN